VPPSVDTYTPSLLNPVAVLIVREPAKSSNGFVGLTAMTGSVCVTALGYRRLLGGGPWLQDRPVNRHTRRAAHMHCRIIVVLLLQ
jgi:hypothetical protein